jgi:hypothetical protein
MLSDDATATTGCRENILKESHTFFLSSPLTPIGCALTFASEAKFEIEVKISFCLEAKKSLISHDSLRCETPKI